MYIKQSSSNLLLILIFFKYYYILIGKIEKFEAKVLLKVLVIFGFGIFNFVDQKHGKNLE